MTFLEKNEPVCKCKCKKKIQTNLQFVVHKQFLRNSQIIFTFNARERLYFISVSSCVSIAYNIYTISDIDEHFAQQLYILFIHIDHLHKVIHYYCHLYYIVTCFDAVLGVWLKACVQCIQCGVFFVGSVLGSNCLFSFRGPFIYRFECFL